MIEKTIDELIKDRDVIYVPIFSMFDKVTNLVNLKCDGNVNRFLTTFYPLQNDYKSLTILCPPKESSVNFDWFENSCKQIKNLKLVQASPINDHAGWQRSAAFASELFSFIKEKLLDYISSLETKPIFIFEGQELGKILSLFSSRAFDLVYWCPVCSTETKSRSFLINDKTINDEIFSLVKTVIVATEEQKEYVSRKLKEDQTIILVNKFIDRKLPFFSYTLDQKTVDWIKQYKKVIYLPFRLSDEGYRIWDIFDNLKIEKLLSEEIVIVSPNVNGSTDEILWKLYKSNSNKLSKEEFLSILSQIKSCPSDRNTYYSILDNCSNIIIPYFEDFDFIMHASVDEFVRNKIKGKVCLKLDEFKNEINYDFSSKIEEAITKKRCMDSLFENIIKSESYLNLVSHLANAYKENNSTEFIFSGVGKNWYICQKVVKTFLSMGLKSEALDPGHALHGDLGMLTGNNPKFLFFISKSGTTEELITLAKVVNSLKAAKILKNIELISFSLNADNPNSKLFAFNLLPQKSNSVFEFDSRNLVPSLSIDIMQLVLDFLGVLLYESDLKLVENYVYNHLAGANGKKLGGNKILESI